MEAVSNLSNKSWIEEWKEYCFRRVKNNLNGQDCNSCYMYVRSMQNFDGERVTVWGALLLLHTYIHN